jgi:CRISPR/Cas system CSM-associated protein Csm4 (group 5 of RAMP superfamily)
MKRIKKASMNNINKFDEVIKELSIISNALKSMSKKTEKISGLVINEGRLTEESENLLLELAAEVLDGSIRISNASFNLKSLVLPEDVEGLIMGVGVG